MKRRMSRRAMLWGSAGVGLSLPWLDAMRVRTAAAQNETAPRRILFAFQANGDQVEARFGSQSGSSFELGEFLAPLQPYRQDVLFLNRLNRLFYELPDGRVSDNHQQGGSSLAPWTSGEGSFPIGGTEDQTIGYVEGPSADYAIGERVLAADPSVAHRHLVFRVGDRQNNIWNLHSHAGPVGQQNPIPPETDPYAAYTRLFTFNEDQAGDALARQLAMRSSALDLVKLELDSLQTKVSTADRRKIEQHAEAVRDIERTLIASTPQPACLPINIEEGFEPYSDDDHVVMGELFFKISALAFACDLTRVINFNWSGNTSNRVYRNLGLTEGHHDISHESSEEAFARIRQIHAHLWTQNTKLYELLKATPDGEGTLWDHTLVVHWNELAQGDTHAIDDALVVLAGKAHGHFGMGRLVDYRNDASFSDLLVSCFQYMGFEDVTEFGDERLRLTGALAGITT